MLKKWMALFMSIAIVANLLTPFASIVTAATGEEESAYQILYEDDFFCDCHYKIACGSNDWNSYKTPVWSDGKLISGNYDKAKDAKTVLLNGLDANEWQNYTVEADVTMQKTAKRELGLIIYGDTGAADGGNGYRFVLYNGAKEGGFRLSKQFGKANYVDETNAPEKTFKSVFGENYAAGEVVHLSVTATTTDAGVQLVCKATYKGTTETIYDCKDVNNTFTKGMPGISMQEQNSTVDNLKVYRGNLETATRYTFYKDDFFCDCRYKIACGSNDWNKYKAPVWSDGKLISGDYSSSNDAKTVLLNGLNASNWQNYTVEADVTMQKSANRELGLVIYGDTGAKYGGNGYRFVLYNGAKGGKLRLSTQFGSSNYVDETNAPDKTFKSVFGEDYAAGEVVHLSVTATTMDDGVQLLCKATYKGTTKTVYDCKDVNNKFTKGMPGISMQEQNSTVDNLDIYGSQPQQEEPPVESIGYEDDFTTSEKYTAALGDTSWSRFNTPLWNETNGRLESGDYTAATDGKFAIFNGLNAEKWANYTIEADIAWEKSDVRELGLVTYGGTGESDGGSGYRFVIWKSNHKDGVTFSLRTKCNKTALLDSKNAPDTTFAAVFGKEYEAGENVHFYVRAITLDEGVRLICKATYQNVTKTVYDYTDSANTYVQGMPGISMQEQNAYLDNLKVYQETEEVQPPEDIPEDIPEDNTIYPEGVLYQDDFTTANRYKAALGSTKWTTYKTPIWEDGKLISGDYDKASKAKFAIFNGLKADNWSNYTVEADISWSKASTRELGLVLYGGTDLPAGGSGYRFVIYNSSHKNGAKFSLRTKVDKKAWVNQEFAPDKSFAKVFGEEYTAGGVVHFSIRAITSDSGTQLICKATYKGVTKVVYNVMDTNKTYTKGMPGVSMQEQLSTLDNLIVHQETSYPGRAQNVALVPQPAPKGVLYEDNFNTSNKYTAALGDISWCNYDPPIWQKGKLYSGNFGDAKEFKFALLEGLGAEGWMNYTVEADVTPNKLNSRRCYVTVYGRTNSVSSYGDGYSFMIQSSNGLFVLNRQNAGDSTGFLSSMKITNFFKDYVAGDMLRLSLTAVTLDDCTVLIAKATYKGQTKVIWNYVDRSAARYTHGIPGFGLQSADAYIDNVKVVGGSYNINEQPEYMKMPLVAPDGTYKMPDGGVEPTVYKDNFEDEKVGTNPSHWIEEGTMDNWKIHQKSGKKVYGTDSKERSYTWLHTFESDPVVEMDFMVESAGSIANIEFLTHYTQADYGKAAIGYDFMTSKWYIHSVQGTDFVPRRVYSEKTFKLTEKQWYSLRIETNEKNVWVYVNDKLVIADGGVEQEGWGRIGVLSENAKMYIDNVTYTMPHGGNVNDGVVEVLWDKSVTSGTLNTVEIESLGGDTLLATGSQGNYISYDKGLTWSNKLKDIYTEVASGKDKKGLYGSVLEIKEGVFLMLYSDTFSIMRSDDYMKTWRKVGEVSQELKALNAKIPSSTSISIKNGAVVHSNSMKMFTLADGTKRIFLPVALKLQEDGSSVDGTYTRIFYSDNYGVTWKESVNDVRDVIPNWEAHNEVRTYTWGESKMWQCSDGTLCLSNTRDYGGLVYLQSHDGGETWEDMQSLPYIQNSCSSHDICEDPKNPGTYYMVCMNNSCKDNDFTATDYRERLTLYKTTDGKDWKYVTDIERYSNYSFEGYQVNGDTCLFQMLDPSITIQDGKMYVNVGRSYSFYRASSMHNYQQIKIVRLDMDKLPETTEYTVANVAEPGRAAKLELDTMPQLIFGVNDVFRMGGTIKATDFTGRESVAAMATYNLASELPDMSKVGTYTVKLMNMFGTTLSYDVEVREKCNVTWEIEGKGTVDEPDKSIIKGVEYTYTTTPGKRYKLAQVFVNGKEIEVKKNQFTFASMEDVNVKVVFEKIPLLKSLADGIADALSNLSTASKIGVSLAAVAVIGAGTAGVIILRKRRLKKAGETTEL